MKKTLAPRKLSRRSVKILLDKLPEIGYTIFSSQAIRLLKTQKFNEGGCFEIMAIQPLGDKVLVKALEAEAKTKGGLVLPDTAKEKPQEGKIVAVGKGKLLDDGTIKPLEVKAGDKVLYGKYSGTEITTKEGEEYLILKEDDILAVIK